MVNVQHGSLIWPTRVQSKGPSFRFWPTILSRAPDHNLDTPLPGFSRIPGYTNTRNDASPEVGDILKVCSARKIPLELDNIRVPYFP